MSMPPSQLQLLLQHLSQQPDTMALKGRISQDSAKVANGLQSSTIPETQLQNDALSLGAHEDSLGAIRKLLARVLVEQQKSALAAPAAADATRVAPR